VVFQWQNEKLLPDKNGGALKLEILKPEQKSAYSKPQIKVVGNTTPGAAVTINGVAAQVRSGGSFTQDITLADGDNKIIISAKLGAEQKVVVINVLLDSTPPLLTVSQPTDNFDPSILGRCDRQRCYIQVFGITEPGVSLRINNIDVSKYVEDDGSFFITDFPVYPTESRLIIEAEDFLKQRTTQTITVSEPTDSDGDNVPDYSDPCPLDPSC
jgi:hypothetical protein